MNASILQWLRSQYINVPQDWVDACVEWITEENEGRRVDKSFLQRQVYEQWLTTDLSELNNVVLPQEILEPKYTLKGTFCLQINSILDVSQPFYGQLNKLQNVDDRNTMVSAETQPTQVWKESANRMLMMKLTDGVNEANGMEYQKISCLSDTIPPGTKVKIIGPVLCRKGVLMLGPSNIQLLGGEVEDLLQPNRKEAVLCRVLNRPVPAASAHQSSNFTNISSNQPGSNNQNGDMFNDFDLPDDIISQLTDDDFNFSDCGYQTASHNLSAQDKPISRQDSKTKINSHSKQISIKDAFAQNFKQSSDVSNSNKSATNTVAVTPILSTLSRKSSNISLNDSDVEMECPSLFSRFKKEEKSKITISDNCTTSHVPAPVCSTEKENVKYKPFKYICQAKSRKVCGETCFTITVKAFILTLLSKLQIEESILKGWLLKARICDGTENLDICFSDQVLTQLIGFTALKANKIRKERNPHDLIQLKAGMESCRTQLVEMCKLMHIEFSSISIPCVTKISEDV